MNENYWLKVLKLAEKATKKGDVPVGALLVNDNLGIVSTGYNKRENKHNILGHAEIECIIKANKCLKTWKLNNCDLYVSLKPCQMCENIIRQSRIRNVYYLVDKDIKKKEYYRTNIKECSTIPFTDQYKKMLANFFKKMR